MNLNFLKRKNEKKIKDVLSSIDEEKEVLPHHDADEEKIESENGFIEPEEVKHTEGSNLVVTGEEKKEPDFDESTRVENFEEELDIHKEESKKGNRIIKILAFSLLGVFIFVLLFLVFQVFTDNGESSKPSSTLPSITEANKEEPVISSEETTVTTNEVESIIENSANDLETNTITVLPNANTINQETASPVVSPNNQYSNPALGISFEYPSHWLENLSFPIQKTPEHVKDVVMVSEPIENNKINNMSIIVESTPISINAKEYIKQTEARLTKIFPKFQKMSEGEITIHGREATTRMYLWVQEKELEKSPYPQEWERIQAYQVYVSGKNKIYLITFTSTDKEFSKNFEQYQKILTTLKLGD